MNNETNNEVALKNDFGMSSIMADNKLFDNMYRMAEVMASSNITVPKHLQGNAGDCMALVMQASQWHMNPFAVAQKTHVVNGVLGYEAQLVAAVLNSSGLLEDRFAFTWSDGAWESVTKDKNPSLEKNLKVTVSATLKGEASPRVLEVAMSQATVRNSPLWVSDPKQQLAYLAQKKWARLYAPDAILGVYTADEIDVKPAGMKDVSESGEIMPAAPAALPPYPHERLAANLAPWSKAINDGRMTTASCIAKIETLNTLTSEQRAQIEALDNVIDAAPVDAADDAAPPF
jgi:hypothetical protein